jgi:predicted O-methyltransferase YrrM
VVGNAIDTLKAFIANNVPPFDFIFIDADKPSYAQYYELCMSLSRPGTVIIADNVVREGMVIDSDTTDEKAKGIREFLAVVAQDQRISSTALQKVGSKKHDGFLLGVVR